MFSAKKCEHGLSHHMSIRLYYQFIDKMIPKNHLGHLNHFAILSKTVHYFALCMITFLLTTTLLLQAQFLGHQLRTADLGDF